MAMDFTLDKYAALCETIAESRYCSITLADYLKQAKKDSQPYIILRHDIDRSPQRALDAARVEHRYNIRATYYFRFQRATYVPDILDEIFSLGHEIGYHYETIDKCKGDMRKAEKLFEKELSDFRSRYNVKTVCAHGNPLTRYDNKSIWQKLKLSDFELLGEAFLSLDFNKFAYFSDSGRTWLNHKSQKMPGKDSVQTAFDHNITKSTDDVIKIISEGKIPNICILSHPERWSKDLFGFTRRYLLDAAFSWGKVAIYAYRQVGK